MSQFYLNTISGPLPPTVPTTFHTINGDAVPAANIITFAAEDSILDNDNGLRVMGSGSTVTYQLTNRTTGQVTTTDATPTTVLSISLGATPGIYYVTGDLVAYNSTDTAGAAYNYSGAARTDGVTATEISTEFKDIFEESAMTTADFNIGVSGNTAFLQVIGIAGKTINWNALITYRFVG